MKKSILTTATDYQKPIVAMVEVISERGFEASSQVDDMDESEGSWY